jgi:hypothetical protein
LLLAYRDKEVVIFVRFRAPLQQMNTLLGLAFKKYSIEQKNLATVGSLWRQTY